MSTAAPGTEAIAAALPVLRLGDDAAVAVRKWAIERALALCPAHLGGASVDKVIEHAGKIEAWVLGGEKREG